MYSQVNEERIDYSVSVTNKLTRNLEENLAYNLTSFIKIFSDCWKIDLYIV